MNKTIEERADEALKNATDMKWTSAYIQGAKEQREIDEQEFKPKWISVDDEMPKEYKRVLLFNPYAEFCEVGSLEDGAWCVMNELYQIEAFLHWMPLPEFPHVNFNALY